VSLGALWYGLTWVGTLGATALTAHALVNRRLLRSPAADPPQVDERVSVLVPARDEEGTIGSCLADLRGQVRVPDLEILVFDDGSGDGTADVVRKVAESDRRVRLLTGVRLPSGWLGKPHACHRLAAAAGGSVLVFVDADVRLAPQALAATVDLLRSGGTDLVSPYPRQIALSSAERLVQPLQQWAWLTTLPLRIAERSPRTSLSAACGQLIAVDARAYRRAGGHRAVRGKVLEDIELLRAVKRSGGCGGLADGTALASCRMYRDWPSVRDGWSKSLWAAFGGRVPAAVLLAALAVLYMVPVVSALGAPVLGAGPALVGLVGYLAGVAGRCLCARRTGGRCLPDGLAHPLSIVLLGWLTVLSCSRAGAGRLSWKGRTIPVLSGRSAPRARRLPRRRASGVGARCAVCPIRKTPPEEGRS
jgi:GT2 family glycosyltransferase